MIGCGKAPPPLAPPDPPVVTVANPIEEELANFIEITGQLEPVDTIDIRTKVNGYITEVGFKDGGDAKAGDLLYEIDRKPFAAELDRTEAEVKNWDAQIRQADADLARIRRGGGAVTQEEVDRAVATKAKAEASLAAAKAVAVKARLNLDDCRILAPISGRLSRTRMTKGNLVEAGTQLTRIVAVNPIRAVWYVDETTSLWYRDQIFTQKTIPNPKDKPMRASIQLFNLPAAAKEKMGWIHGEIDFIEPEIDRLTGSRYLRATFPNADGLMGSGDSVVVRVEAGAATKRILIPDIAVGSQQKLKYVMVVNDQDVAEFRPVVVGQVRNGMQIIESGLTPKDRVVVNGLLRVRPGMKVAPKPAVSAKK